MVFILGYFSAAQHVTFYMYTFVHFHVISFIDLKKKNVFSCSVSGCGPFFSWCDNEISPYYRKIWVGSQNFSCKGFLS